MWGSASVDPTTELSCQADEGAGGGVGSGRASPAQACEGAQKEEIGVNPDVSQKWGLIFLLFVPVPAAVSSERIWHTELGKFYLQQGEYERIWTEIKRIEECPA